MEFDEGEFGELNKKFLLGWGGDNDKIEVELNVVVPEAGGGREGQWGG